VLVAPAAAADGVIVKSAVIDHPVGSVVTEGEVLKLPVGQTVTVLDRSGALLVLSAGAYAGPARRDAAGLVETAAALAAGPQGRATLGGTRTGEDEACESRSAKKTDACIPHGVVVKRLRVLSYSTAHGDAQLVLESNFDGYAVCVGWNPSEDSRFLAGADPAHPLTLTASSPARLESSRTTTGSSNAPGSIECTGISPGAWASLKASASEALTPNSTAIVLSSFSRMRGDTAAEARAAARPVP
jgi:hypothetical protein